MSDQPAGASPSAAPAGPYTLAEYDAFVSSVWSLDGAEDLTRFHDLLHAALAYVGRVAIDGPAPHHVEQARAARLLRAMEQRALWGPDHPVRYP